MSSIFRSNSIKGLAVVVTFLVLIGVSGQVENVVDNPMGSNERCNPEVSFRAVFAEDIEEDHHRFLPVDFESEVLDLESFSDIRVSSDGAVVGFFSSTSPSETKALCSDLLEKRGWTEVASGQESLSSYVRTSESYTWVLLSCTAMNEGSAVVLQVSC